MIYSSAEPEEVAAMQSRHGRDRASELIEGTMGRLAGRLREAGFTRFLLAGGETSGAVVSALDVRTLRIGPEIAPGVPWCEAPGLALALKSGNFGGPDFFLDAWEMLR